jgi:menaquinone-dependent protoporphyrinogen oxidase
MKVLVAYATRHGATAGLADRIAERLRADGLAAESRVIHSLGDIDEYDAFVIGGATYMFRWLKESTDFVNRNRPALAARPTWLFTSGPVGTDTVDKQGRDVLQVALPREFPGLVAAIKPRGTKAFFGALDFSQKPIGFGERFVRLMPAAKASMPQGDFRDWMAVDAWADEIAADLKR